jgi:hypothetical protein
MDSAKYARGALEQAFNLINQCADGIDEAQYNWNPGGTCNAISRSHVHATSAYDFFINALVGGGKSSWPAVAEANGLPANPLQIWHHTGTVPMEAMKEYARMAQASALDVVSKLGDDDFDRVIETQFFGKQTAAFMVQLATIHTCGHAGDIATVKGMQGLKGLPF